MLGILGNNLSVAKLKLVSVFQSASVLPHKSLAVIGNLDRGTFLGSDTMFQKCRQFIPSMWNDALVLNTSIHELLHQN